MRGVTGDSLSLSLFLFVAALANFRKGLHRREHGFFLLPLANGFFPANAFFFQPNCPMCFDFSRYLIEKEGNLPLSWGTQRTRGAT